MRRITPYLTFLASIVTLVLAFLHFKKVVEPSSLIGMLILGGFALFFLAFSVAQEYRYSRKARYSEALYYIYEIFYKCLDFDRLNKDQIEQNAKEISEKLSHMFSMITATRCSSCIKIIDDTSQNGETNLSVSTFCRDSSSDYRSAGKHKKVIHWLRSNTDFLEMLESKDRPYGGTFIHGNLPNMSDYINTSFEVYEKPPKDIGIPVLREIWRGLNWPLPYKSTLGAAIYPFEPEESDVLVGFICVDSGSRYVFNRRHDIMLLRAISNMIYPMMKKWVDLTIKESNHNITEKKEDNDEG